MGYPSRNKAAHWAFHTAGETTLDATAKGMRMTKSRCNSLQLWATRETCTREETLQETLGHKGSHRRRGCPSPMSDCLGWQALQA